MLFLPVGRDESVVRRNPWVSYAIIALNVSFYIAVNLAAPSPNYDELNRRFDQIATYLEKHPYLVIPEELRPLIRSADQDSLARVSHDLQVANQLPEAVTIAREQQELDRMSRELLEMTPGARMRRLGFTPAHPKLLTRFTSLFVHADLSHLLGNLFFFFATAPFLEDVMGRPLFALLYLLGGLIATSVHSLHNAQSMIPVIGASGAIAAVMGAYLVRFARSQTEFLWLPFPLIPRYSYRFFIPAYVIFPLWFLMQLFFAVYQPDAGVAFWAHVGGFVFGVAFFGLFKLARIEERFINPAVESKISWKRSEHLDRADAAKASGDYATARKEILQLLQREPENIDARREICDVAYESEDWNLYSMQMTKLLETYLRSGERDLAIQLVSDAARDPKAVLSDRFLLRGGDLARQNGDTGWAAELYERSGERAVNGGAAVRAYIKAATLNRAIGRADLARNVLEKASRHPECVGELQAEVQQQKALLATQ
jgi:membrane associated rhomboid family serine protease